MQIVIDIHDIPKNDHERWVLTNGTPLPKGHGRLVDENDLIPDSDYDDGTFYAVSIVQINSAPTIIEAESEDKE